MSATILLPFQVANTSPLVLLGTIVGGLIPLIIVLFCCVSSVIHTNKTWIIFCVSAFTEGKERSRY